MKPPKEPKQKRQKHFINRLRGRQLRVEFAEDAQTRYKKRYPKNPKVATHLDAIMADETTDKAAKAMPTRGKVEMDARREQRRKRHDAATAAKTSIIAPKANGAIVAATGRKMLFDE